MPARTDGGCRCGCLPLKALPSIFFPSGLRSNAISRIPSLLSCIQLVTFPFYCRAFFACLQAGQKGGGFQRKVFGGSAPKIFLDEGRAQFFFCGKTCNSSSPTVQFMRVRVIPFSYHGRPVLNGPKREFLRENKTHNFLGGIESYREEIFKFWVRYISDCAPR